MLDIALGTVAVAGAAVSVAGFAANSSTPVQVGPVPVLGGAGVALACVLWLIGRHVTWH